MWGCSVPCKMFQDELEDLCRREKIFCKDLDVSKSNINDYEVEFLCDYKKTKVSDLQTQHFLLQTSFSFIDLLRMKEMCEHSPLFI